MVEERQNREKGVVREVAEEELRQIIDNLPDGRVLEVQVIWK